MSASRSLGFGASAHLALQVLQHWGCETVVLTRGDGHRELARELGASWVGDAAEMPPGTCDRAVVFAPAGELVPVALAGRAARRHGEPRRHPHEHDSRVRLRAAWRERSLRSVANMTRRDAQEFMELAADADVRVAFKTVSARGRERCARRDRRRRGPRRRRRSR